MLLGALFCITNLFILFSRVFTIMHSMHLFENKWEVEIKTSIYIESSVRYPIDLKMRRILNVRERLT